MTLNKRCRNARVPEHRGFATKPEVARGLVLRALASPLPIPWVTADAAYGQEGRFRRILEEAGVGYVLAVPTSQQVRLLGRIDHVLAGARDEAWERISCGPGSKGPRVFDWAAARLPADAELDGNDPAYHRWVLARRSLARPGPTRRSRRVNWCRNEDLDVLLLVAHGKEAKRSNVNAGAATGRPPDHWG